ncbi:MAG: hypothetical protein V8R80_07015 [Eubacterium sp.]
MGSTRELKLTEDETWTNIKWKSSDASVVSVSSSGVITGQRQEQRKFQSMYPAGRVFITKTVFP